MTGIVLNEIRKGFYLDSVALMRLSREVAAMPGVKSRNHEERRPSVG
jgi:hypothetical protein